MKLITDEGIEINIEHVRVMDCPEDAIIVLEHPGVLTQQAIKNIQQTATAFFKRQVVILEEGMKVYVLTDGRKIKIDD